MNEVREEPSRDNIEAAATAYLDQALPWWKTESDYIRAQMVGNLIQYALARLNRGGPSDAARTEAARRYPEHDQSGRDDFMSGAAWALADLAEPRMPNA